MEPYISNANKSRRQALMDQRLEQRLFALCVPVLLPQLGGNEVTQAQSMIMTQLNHLRKNETSLLSRKTEFLAKVINERCTQILETQARRAKEVSLLAKDRLIASKPSEAEQLRRTLKSEISQRFSKLQQAFTLEDRLQTGKLSPNRIRMLCRQFNLESGTLDNVLAESYTTTEGDIPYAPLVEKLIQVDYADLFNNANDGNTNQSLQNEWVSDYQDSKNPTNNGLILGRSSLRRRTDGVGGSVRLRQEPVDEWAVISKNNMEIANKYEEDINEKKRKDTYQYAQELKERASRQKELSRKREEDLKQKEREAEIYKYNQYLSQQQKDQERKKKIELEAWREGHEAIRIKREEQNRIKRDEVNEAKERIRKYNEDAEREYMNSMQEVQKKREQWRKSLEQNMIQMKRKEQQLQEERRQDKERQEEYAKMLEKEHLSRMKALQKSLNYRPPDASIRAAEDIIEKAKRDEERAFRVQRLKEAEQNEIELNKEKRRKQRDLETAQFLKKQAADKIQRENNLKYEDIRQQKQLLLQVQDAIKEEETIQMNRKEKARLLAREQRMQAQRKDKQRALKDGMSPRERAYNRDMFDSLASRNNGSALSNTGRRLFG